MLFVVPRIEKYSQNAAIEFYKNTSGQNYYVETLGFKSYADLFYFNKPVPTHNKTSDMDYLLKGNIDKSVYFVCKNTKSDKYQKQYPELKKLYEKNGFVFFVRKIK